jgi:hypothetical protein
MDIREVITRMREYGTAIPSFVVVHPDTYEEIRKAWRYGYGRRMMKLARSRYRRIASA